jgi:general secretion pathway protein J
VTPTPGREAGFTLVELLVTLALMSVLSLIVLGSLRFGIKAWQRGSVHAESIDRVQHAATMLRSLVEDAYPYYATGGEARNRIAFQGTSESLTFLASTPLALGGKGRSRFRVFVERRDDQAHLMLSSVAELTDSLGTIAPARLVENIKAVTISYLSATVPAKDAIWQAEWPLSPQWPRLVRVDVQFHEGDARIWPELIIAPRIDVDVGCTYDLLSKRCRGR